MYKLMSECVEGLCVAESNSLEDLRTIHLEEYDLNCEEYLRVYGGYIEFREGCVNHLSSPNDQ